MSARFVGGKVLAALVTLAFVIAFNFFLFRVIQGDPVANLFRGRNLSATQREALNRQFGLDKSLGGQFVAYVKQTASLNLGRTYTTNQPVASEIAHKAWPTLALVGLSTRLLRRVRRARRDRRGLAKTHAHRLWPDVADHGHLLDARLLARDAAAELLRASRSAGSR